MGKRPPAKKNRKKAPLDTGRKSGGRKPGFREAKATGGIGRKSGSRKPSFRKAKTTNKRTNSSHIVVGFVGLLFALYLAGYFINNYNKPTIVFATVEKGSIDLPVVHKGIIIRDEKVYVSSQEGTVYFAVSDKEKVKKDAVVCRISNEEITGTLANSLSQVEQDIMDMQKRRSDITAFQADAERTNKLIKESVDESIYKFIGSDMSSLYLLREDIDKHMTLRNQKLLNEDRGSISELVQKKDGLEAQLNQNIAVIKAEEGGIVSYGTDGLEGNFNFENLTELTKEQTTMKAPSSLEVRGQVVKEQDQVFKIIRSNEWYLAAYLDNKLTISYEEKSNLTLYVDKDGEFRPLPVTISSIIKGPEESCVIYKVTKDILDFADARSIEFKTERSVYSGLKIPNTAIIDGTFLKVPNEYIAEDQYGGTFVTKRDAAGDIRIGIGSQSNRDELYTYVAVDYSSDSKSLRTGDSILYPKDGETLLTLTETANMKGVYRVNSGIAEFIKINVEGELVENSGYCVLDPVANPRLRVQDRIIPEPKNIMDGQLIY